MKLKNQFISLLAVSAICKTSALAGTVGFNIQSSSFGFGPFSVASFGSAYGTAAADWLEVGSQGGAPASGGISYSTPSPFASPSMNGGSMSVSYSAGGEYCAFGYCYANNGGAPTTGEEAVLSGNVFGTTPPNTQGDHPIVVTFSGLNSFAASYTVKLIAAQDDGNKFRPAHISDGTTQEDINFSNVVQGGGYNPTAGVPRQSPSDVETSVNTYTGNTLTITISGVDEGFSGGDRTRNALSGVVLTFTPSGGGSAPKIIITRNAGNVTLTWSGGGTLLSSDTPGGTYNPVLGASSPYTTAASGSAKYYRVSIP